MHRQKALFDYHSFYYSCFACTSSSSPSPPPSSPLSTFLPISFDRSLSSPLNGGSDSDADSHPRDYDDQDVGAYEPSNLNQNEVGLRHVLSSLVRLAGDLVQLSAPEDVETAEEAVNVMLPLVLDATTEGLVDFAMATLERVLGPSEGGAFERSLFYRLFSQCHQILTNFEEELEASSLAAPNSASEAATTLLPSAPTAASTANQSKRRRKSPSIDESEASTVSSLDERILHEIIKFIDANIDRESLQHAMLQFYSAR